MSPTSCVATIVGDPLLPLGLGSLCYGCFTMLFVLSSHVLLTRTTGKIGLNCRAKFVLFFTTFLMFTIATAHIATVLTYAGLYPRLQEESSAEDLLFSQQLQKLVLILPGVNSGLSDVVVAWRAWLLWGRSVRTFLIVWMLAGFVAAPLAYRSNVCYGQIVGFCSSLFNNVTSISLVAYKAWEHRQFVRDQLNGRMKPTKVERILLLLVESGTLYTLAWALYAVGEFTPIPSLNDFMLVSIAHLSGIYPTLVVCLVYRQAERCQNGLSQCSEMQFAPQPGVASTVE